jgi:N-methylhydantoinase A/oxoprolinase/acetone carboxylase beta subunit
MATAPVIKDIAAAVFLRIDAPVETPQTFGASGLRNEGSRSGSRKTGSGTQRGVSTGDPSEVLSGVREKLERRGRAELESEGFALDGLEIRTILDMRYTGQSYELPVTSDSLDPGEFLPLFHAAHQERYGHSDASRAVEVVNLRIKLVLPGPTVGAQGLAPLRPPGAPAPASQRDVWFDGEPVPTAVYDRGAPSRNNVHRPRRSRRWTPPP